MKIDPLVGPGQRADLERMLAQAVAFLQQLAAKNNGFFIGF